MALAWSQFQSAVSSQTTYDFATAYKEWNQAQFDNMVSVATEFLKTKLPDEIAYWANSNGQSVLPVGRAAAAKILADLTTLQGGLSTKISIVTTWIK